LIVFSQEHTKSPKWRIVVFDFKIENIPQDESSYFEKAKTDFPRSIENALFKRKSDLFNVLERPLLPDVHKEVEYAEDNRPLFDITTVTKIKTKGGNAALVGVLSYTGSGDIKIIARLVEIETSALIATDERKVNLDKFRKKSEKLANELAKKIATRLDDKKKSGRSIIRDPKIWAAVATVASAIWWYAENNRVKTNDEIYDQATTTVDATTAGIAADKSVTRREIAAISTGASAGAFLIFLVFNF
jgi:hypothetical protein